MGHGLKIAMRIYFTLVRDSQSVATFTIFLLVLKTDYLFDEPVSSLPCLDLPGPCAGHGECWDSALIGHQYTYISVCVLAHDHHVATGRSALLRATDWLMNSSRAHTHAHIVFSGAHDLLNINAAYGLRRTHTCMHVFPHAYIYVDRTSAYSDAQNTEATLHHVSHAQTHTHILQSAPHTHQRTNKITPANMLFSPASLIQTNRKADKLSLLYFKAH